MTSTNHTEIIKDKLSILDVVGSYVTLQKAGKTWKGKSPFTNEKTPSFFVSPDKGFYYCFSSGKGGDIFSFIQEIERVDFREALKILADKAGVDLGSGGGASSINKVLYQILDDTTKWYEVNLRKNKEAVDYLLKRGLSKDTIVKFRLGFAKDSWQDMYDYLKKKGYSDQNIEACGLITKKDGGRGFYDRFRSRIMFPLFDSRGRVVGFSGRIFSDNSNEKGAKYVNSPEGPLFDKSKLLYGYHSAKSAISKTERCIIVEGQFDVLMAQQAGSENTVAVSGTGLTDDHIKLISRFADTVLFAFDSDKAGIKATKRSVLKAYEHGMKAQVIALPLGEDPADIISSGKAKWEVYLADAKDYIDYRLELFDAQFPDASFEDKHKLVTSELFDFVYLTKSSVVQDRVLQDLALYLGVDVQSIRNDFDGFAPSDEVRDAESSPGTSVTDAGQEGSSNNDSIGQTNILELISYLQEQYPETYQDHSKEIENQYQEIYQYNLDDAQKQQSKEHQAMSLFKLEVQLKDKKPEALIDDIHIALNHELKRMLQERSQELLKSIREAQHHNDDEKLITLQQQHMELRRRIDQLNHQKES